MDATNVQLQLIECIESMKNDVKRKIGTRQYRRAMYVEETTRSRDDLATVARKLYF
jgi:hypothetical protein